MGLAAVCDTGRKWLTGNRAPCKPGVEPAPGRRERGREEAVPARRSGEGGPQWLRPAGSPAAGRAPAETAGRSGQRPPPGDDAHLPGMTPTHDPGPQEPWWDMAARSVGNFTAHLPWVPLKEWDGRSHVSGLTRSLLTINLGDRLASSERPFQLSWSMSLLC